MRSNYPVLRSQAKVVQLRPQPRLITAAVALALPGPDLVTTFLELLPMWVLFEGSIWLAVLFERRQPAPSEAVL